MKKAKILVLCTANSCRSQMAEGLIRNRFGDRVAVFSAGASPAERVHPMAVSTLMSRGIDISTHRPQSTSEFLNDAFDFVITTCDAALDACPVFPGEGKKIHWGLQDPAKVSGTEADIASAFSSTADLLEQHISELEPLVEEINKSGE